MVLVLCKLIIIVNHTSMWHFLKAQGEVVGEGQARNFSKAETASPKDRDGEQGQGIDSYRKFSVV